MTDSNQGVELDPQVVLQMLESLQRAGVTDLPAAEPLPIAFETAGEQVEAAGASTPPTSAPTTSTHAMPAPRPTERMPDRPDSNYESADSSSATRSDVETGSVQPVPQAATPTSAPPSTPPPSPTQPNLLPNEAPNVSDCPEANLVGVDPAAALQIVEQEVRACTRCDELASTRTQTVFGVGNPNPRLVFLGEAPGADEDRQGEPFVGAAGQLLNKILTACTLSREDVYILNILKCRPPGNRNPNESEEANCRAFLDRQLAILQPEYICCLGGVAAKGLLDTMLTVGRLRGKFHDYHGTGVLVTYHPAYLLRNPGAKRQVWDDMQFLMAEMGIELPNS